MAKCTMEFLSDYIRTRNVINTEDLDISLMGLIDHIKQDRNEAKTIAQVFHQVINEIKWFHPQTLISFSNILCWEISQIGIHSEKASLFKKTEDCISFDCLGINPLFSQQLNFCKGLTVLPNPVALEVLSILLALLKKSEGWQFLQILSISNYESSSLTDFLKNILENSPSADCVVRILDICAELLILNKSTAKTVVVNGLLETITKLFYQWRIKADTVEDLNLSDCDSFIERDEEYYDELSDVEMELETQVIEAKEISKILYAISIHLDAKMVQNMLETGVFLNIAQMVIQRKYKHFWI